MNDKDYNPALFFRGMFYAVFFSSLIWLGIGLLVYAVLCWCGIV